jgi:hypothetical protein
MTNDPTAAGKEDCRAGRFLLEPLFTGERRAARGVPQTSHPLPPLHFRERDQFLASEQASSGRGRSAASVSESFDHSSAPGVGAATATAPYEEADRDGWRDDAEDLRLGAAEPEDELPLLDQKNPAVGASAALENPPVPVTPMLPVSWPEPRRLEEVAERLEGIARSLRDPESAGSLAAHAKDPLGALITGYLLGYFEASETRAQDASG